MSLREHTKKYYNNLLKEKFNKNFDLNIYSFEEHQKAYQKEYREKHKLKCQNYRKQYNKYYKEKYKDRLKEERHKKTNKYKLKLELERITPIDDNFDNIDMILDF
jgi:hypothetical protein